jgi:hypothetical protein
MPALVGGSALLRASFVALTLLVAGLFVAGVYWSAMRTGLDRPTVVRRSVLAAALAAAWIAVTGVAAAAGALHFEPPPTMLVLFPSVIAIAIGLALSPLGKRIALGLPLAVLVGYQGFRVGVELLMHRAYVEGLMPVQMSYSGRNFDIVTGITAILLGVWLASGRRRSRGLVFAWNTLGLALLVNVVAVAVLSAPTPLRVFMNEPANVWITRAPWVWLPAVLVLAALCGHVLVYRRLLADSPASRLTSSSATAPPAGFVH